MLSNNIVEDMDGLYTPLQPHTILLKDDETIATMYPIPSDPALFPKGLLSFILDEFNMEIVKGVSFPYYETLNEREFKDIWFHKDGHLCIMVLGEIPELDYSVPNDQSDIDNNYGTKVETMRHTSKYISRKSNRNLNLNIQWEKQCLGVFSLQPAYPGRSSHISTGYFLVNAGIRGKGIGKTLVETFLEWATHLGFTSAYFPLVYGTNVGMRCILEELNFKRVGMLPSSGILKGYDIPIDSFIYEKELTSITKSIEMFKGHDRNNVIAKYERMLYYMEHKKYPKNCDKTEKARIRMHSKKHTLENGKIMFKGKEVVYDPVKQRRIAIEEHCLEHAGVNKVTARISKRYHWNGIKNTVLEATSQCDRCKSRFSDDTGVIVTSNENVKQAHMLPDHSIKAQDLVHINKRSDYVSQREQRDVSDKLINLIEIVQNVNSAQSQVNYDGPTPKDKQDDDVNRNTTNEVNVPLTTINTTTPPDHFSSSIPDATSINMNTINNSSDTNRKRTYESAVQHGLLAKQSSGALGFSIRDDGLNNNIDSSNNHNVDKTNFSIEETINMNMRRLNKIVEEEEMKKRRKITSNDSNDSHGSKIMYEFKDISSTSTIGNTNDNSDKRNDQYTHNEKDNNSCNHSNHNSSVLHLDTNVIEALNLVSKSQNNDSTNYIGNNHDGRESYNNVTNIPLIFDFGDDYLEEEDEDYEEPDATSATGKEEDDDEDDEYEYEYEERGENGENFADQLEELSIEHELQSLQNFGDEDLNFHTNIRH